MPSASRAFLIVCRSSNWNTPEQSSSSTCCEKTIGSWQSWRTSMGLQGGQACWVTSHIDIAKAIEESHTRRRMAFPFVIAVNCTGPWTDWEEIRDSIFGDEGLWPSAHRALFRRVSPVLAVHHLLPWSVARADAWLFHNPNAAIPYSAS